MIRHETVADRWVVLKNIGLDEQHGGVVCGLGVDDDVLHVRLALADVVLEPAGELVRVGQRHLGRHGDGDEDDEAAGGVQEPQLARRLAGALDARAR